MEKHYWKIFSAVVIIKLVLAYSFPITSDEAYYYTWGQYLDVNYYDHPPVTGWIIYLFYLLGSHIFFSRLFSSITGIIVAIGIYLVAKEISRDENKARLVSLVYLVVPWNFIVLISSDVPLFLFVFLSGVFFYYGINMKKSSLVLVSGIFLSLAILSKYFAGLLLIAFCGHLILRPSRNSIKYGLILILGTLPLLLLHLYWNYTDCWTTLMFNVFNRNKDHSLKVGTFLKFVLFQIILSTPWMLYYVARNLKFIRAGIKRDNNLFFHLFIIPVSILGMLAFFDTSLHWTISFYPFLFILLVYLDSAQLTLIIKFSGILSLMVVLIIAIILMLPVETFKNHRYYRDIVMGFYGNEIYEKIKKYEDQYVFGTPGYTTAALMTYHSGKHFIVFMDDDRNGRNDDKLTDFKALDGRNILILSTLKVKAKEYQDYRNYFKHLVIDTLGVRQANYTLIFGEGFQYEKYRDTYLSKILLDCYDIPGFLPIGDCFFFNRYFPERNRHP